MLITNKILSPFKKNYASFSWFVFNAKEKDYESGFHYYGSRYYSSEISTWLSTDPMADKYPSLTPYNYCANNPIKLIDPNGEEIDLSNLTKKEKDKYLKNIEILKQNKMFQTYYDQLEKSDTKYTIKSGRGAGGSGSFNEVTKEVHSIDDLYVLSQELFHAYQSDIGVYTSRDLSVRETEADIVSQNIAISLNWGVAGSAIAWDGGLSFKENYVDSDLYFKESIFLSKQFDNDFNTAVNNRINYYKNRDIEINDGTKGPATYLQKNSGVGALAIKRLVRDMNKNK